MIVYIIDDIETNLDLFEAIVRKVDDSLIPVCFSDPVEALRACETRLPDVVAVDYMMPGMNGHEFVRAFRALPEANAVPIIMITAAIERQVRRTALDLGVSDFLTKPVDPYETRARLKTIIALRRSYLEVEDRGRWLADEVEKATATIVERERGIKLGLAVAEAANRKGSVRDVFQFVLGEICKFTGWELGLAYFAETGQLEASSAWYVSLGANDSDMLPVFQSPPGAGSLASGVMAAGTAKWVEALDPDDSDPKTSMALSRGLRRSCAIPVMLGIEVAAVLQFYTTGALGLDETRLGLLAQLASQIGRTIERAQAEAALIFNASHDPLTKLPNRLLFSDRLQHALASYKRDPSLSFALLFIDLDRFKIINDSLGHHAGDDLLKQVADRLKSCLRRADTVSHAPSDNNEAIGTLARIGGDEFTILLDGVPGPSDGLRVAERIQAALALPFTISTQQVYTGASIGITMSAPSYESSEAMLRDADLAMYRAKSLGKGRSEVFDRAMHEAAMTRLTLESDLRRALRNEEFVLHYQPIVSLATRKLVGVEALLRWQMPSGELANPARFIGVAEETGLIIFLGAWVMREACLALKRWDSAYPKNAGLTVSVNVSVREFNEPGFVEQVARILRETGVDPTRIRLEIIESVTIGDADYAVKVLSELRALGVHLSVDDFGVGYSSLSYLHRFPLNILKIDRSFVTDIVANAESREMINSIIGLARSMGLEVIAEGAEHEDQVAELKKLGCDFGQGFVFHRPLDLQSMSRLLSEGGDSAELAGLADASTNA